MNASNQESAVTVPSRRWRPHLWLGAALATLGAVTVFAPSAGAVQVTEFPLPSGGTPFYITPGPDGNMWFTDKGTNSIGKITMDGQVTEYGLGITASAEVNGIAAGPDGNLWFTERKGHKIGRITPSGAATEFSTGLTGSPDIYGITSGPEGKVWFTETNSSRIGSIVPTTGEIKEISVPAGVHTEIVQGPDGNLWYTAVDKATINQLTLDGKVKSFGPLAASDCAVHAISPCPYPESLTVGGDGNLWFDESRGDAIGRISTSGAITEYTDGLTHEAAVADLTAGPEGNVWFTEATANQVGRITPSGQITEFGSGFSKEAVPFGIALGSDQNLWVTEFKAGKVARVIPDVPPVVATGPPSAVHSKTAAVTGQVRSRGADTIYYFEYGPSPAYKRSGIYKYSTVHLDNGAGDTTVSVLGQLKHLAAGTGYHYRIAAVNASGVSYGADGFFKTKGKRRQGGRIVGPYQMYFAGRSLRGHIRLNKVIILGVRRGESVSYLCKRCAGGPAHSRRRAPGRRIAFRAHLIVSARSTLKVNVTGNNGSRRVKLYGFRISAAESTLKGQRCLAPGKKHKRVSCHEKASHGGAK